MFNLLLQFADLNVKYYNGKFDAYQRTYIIEDNSNGEYSEVAEPPNMMK